MTAGGAGDQTGTSASPCACGHPSRPGEHSEIRLPATAAAPWTVTLGWTPDQNLGQVSVLPARAPLPAVLGSLQAGEAPAGVARDFGLTVEAVEVLARLADDIAPDVTPGAPTAGEPECRWSDDGKHAPGFGRDRGECRHCDAPLPGPGVHDVMWAAGVDPTTYVPPVVTAANTTPAPSATPGASADEPAAALRAFADEVDSWEADDSPMGHHNRLVYGVVAGWARSRADEMEAAASLIAAVRPEGTPGAHAEACRIIREAWGALPTSVAHIASRDGATLAECIRAIPAASGGTATPPPSPVPETVQEATKRWADLLDAATDTEDWSLVEETRDDIHRAHGDAWWAASGGTATPPGPHADYDIGVREELVDVLYTNMRLDDHADAERVADALISQPALLRALARFSAPADDTPPPDDAIPLAALRALAQGEPADEVADDHGVPAGVVRAVLPLVGRPALGDETRTEWAVGDPDDCASDEDVRIVDGPGGLTITDRDHGRSLLTRTVRVSGWRAAGAAVPPEQED